MTGDGAKTGGVLVLSAAAGAGHVRCGGGAGVRLRGERDRREARGGPGVRLLPLQEGLFGPVHRAGQPPAGDPRAGLRRHGPPVEVQETAPRPRLAQHPAPRPAAPCFASADGRLHPFPPRGDPSPPAREEDPGHPGRGRDHGLRPPRHVAVPGSGLVLRRVRGDEGPHGRARDPAGDDPRDGDPHRPGVLLAEGESGSAGNWASSRTSPRSSSPRGGSGWGPWNPSRRPCRRSATPSR